MRFCSVRKKIGFYIQIFIVSQLQTKDNLCIHQSQSQHKFIETKYVSSTERYFFILIYKEEMGTHSASFSTKYWPEITACVYKRLATCRHRVSFAISTLLDIWFLMALTCFMIGDRPTKILEKLCLIIDTVVLVLLLVTGWT